MILYVNGCSWSVMTDEKCMSPAYGDFLAERLGAKLINSATMGASNARIFRTTISDITALRSDSQEDIVCVIGLTWVGRFDIWVPTSVLSTFMRLENSEHPSASVLPRLQHQHRQSNDGNFLSSTTVMIPELQRLLRANPTIAPLMKSAVTSSSDSHAWYEFVCDLVALINFLENNQIKYLIFSSCHQPNQEAINQLRNKKFDSLLDKINTTPQVYDLYGDGFVKWAFLQRKQDDI